MKRLNLVYIMIVAVMTLVIAPAYAEPQLDEKEGPKPGFREERKAEMDKIMDEIGLTPEQKTQIETFHKEQRAKDAELRTKMQEKREALREELTKTDSDTVKIEQLKTDMTAIYEEKMQARIDGVLKIKETLTPEQYEKLNQKMKEKHEAWKEKKGTWGEKIKEHRKMRKP